MEAQLLKDGHPYRTIESINEVGMSTDFSPGAHDIAPPPPNDYPGFKPIF